MTTVRETFGLECPKCGSDAHILVTATELVRLVPDGTVSASDQEWALDSTACCTTCNHSGIVADFEAKDDQPPLARPSSHDRAPMANDVCCELAHALTVRECRIRGITLDALPSADDDENHYAEEAQRIFDAIYDVVTEVLEPYCEEVAP